MIRDSRTKVVRSPPPHVNVIFAAGFTMLGVITGFLIVLLIESAGLSAQPPMIVATSLPMIVQTSDPRPDPLLIAISTQNAILMETRIPTPTRVIPTSTPLPPLCTTTVQVGCVNIPISTKIPTTTPIPTLLPACLTPVPGERCRLPVRTFPTPPACEWSLTAPTAWTETWRREEEDCLWNGTPVILPTATPLPVCGPPPQMVYPCIWPTLSTSVIASPTVKSGSSTTLSPSTPVSSPMPSSTSIPR